MTARRINGLANRGPPYSLGKLPLRRWGWFHLSTILDEYSRYVITWRLLTQPRGSGHRLVESVHVCFC